MLKPLQEALILLVQLQRWVLFCLSGGVVVWSQLRTALWSISNKRDSRVSLLLISSKNMLLGLIWGGGDKRLMVIRSAIVKWCLVRFIGVKMLLLLLLLLLIIVAANWESSISTALSRPIRNLAEWSLLGAARILMPKSGSHLTSTKQAMMMWWRRSCNDHLDRLLFLGTSPLFLWCRPPLVGAPLRSSWWSIIESSL